MFCHLADAVPQCANWVEGLGSNILFLCFMAGVLLGLFLVVRLLVLSFTFRNRWKEDEHIAYMARVQARALANDLTEDAYIRQLAKRLKQEVEAHPELY